MRDVINAGLDPHRWFAGVMNKIITPDLKNKDDPEWVDKTSKFLKENVTSEQRQHAKAKIVGPLTRDSYSKESGVQGSLNSNAWLLAAEPIDGQIARYRKVHRLVHTDVHTSVWKHSCSGMGRLHSRYTYESMCRIFLDTA